MKRLLAVVGLSLTLTSGLSCNLSFGDCTNVSVDACGSTKGCLLLYAEPVRAQDDPSMACLKPALPVSCGNPRTCDELSPSLAKDATGNQWVLQSPCVPAGWTRISASASFNPCPTCQTLSVLTCASDDSCQKVYGRRIDQSRSCLSSEEAVGCYDAAANCRVGPSRWFDDSGQEWILPGNCPGPSWHNSTSRNTTLGLCPSSDGGVGGVGDDGGDASSPDCASLSVTACAATTGCRVLEGQQINHQRSCVLPKKAAGCQRADVGCGGAFTRATDPTDIEWSFPSTCIPAGWTNVSSSGAFFPECSSLGGPTDGATQ